MTQVISLDGIYLTLQFKEQQKTMLGLVHMKELLQFSRQWVNWVT